MIRQYKTFDNPFFKLLLLNNIAYLILWLLIHVGQYNFPIYQRLFVEFKEPDEYVVWKAFVRYLTECCAFTTFLCCFFLSINRLTTIMWPIKHERVIKHLNILMLFRSGQRFSQLLMLFALSFRCCVSQTSSSLKHDMLSIIILLYRSTILMSVPVPKQLYG